MKRWKPWGAAVTSVIISSLVFTTPGSEAAVGNKISPTRQLESNGDSLRDRVHHPLRVRLGLSAAERLVLKDVVRDPDGTAHKRFDRTYRGLPVIGGDLIVHRSPTGRVTVDWATEADLGQLASARPRVSAVSAANVAGRSTHLRAHPSGAELVVYAVGAKARLAWQATASGAGSRELVFVDATSGIRIAGWSEIHHAKGKGRTLYSGRRLIPTVKVTNTKFLLRDPGRGNHRVFDARNGSPALPPTGVLMQDRDNVWGNHLATSRQSAAADVAYGHRVTWDFYKNVLGRNGIRNNGTTPRSFVHVGNNYENASFDDQCYCMRYGDGGSTFRPLVSLDVVAHEMSHGTTAATANLIYFGESGGLNEATSDIFGSMAEFHAGITKDPGDYIIGEKIVEVAPKFLRRMDNPAKDAPLYGGAAHSYSCWNATMGADDVHFSSGPANHFFYLLAEGSGAKVIGGRQHNSPTCNATTMAGIGRLAAGKIWYRALNVYMTSTTNYMLARDATIRAARDLFGPTSIQCARVVRAWNAVAAPAGTWTCATPPPPLGANVVANSGFELGPNGDWTDPNNAITNSLNAFPRSGSWYAWLNGFGQPSVNTISQEIAVPNSANAKLRLWVLINTSEAAGSPIRDTLEVRVDDADPGVDTLATYSNLNANNSYTKKTLDMAAYAGQTVVLSLRGVETNTLQTSFLVDTVTVTPS